MKGYSHTCCAIENPLARTSFHWSPKSTMLLWCLELVYLPMAQSLYLGWIKFQQLLGFGQKNSFSKVQLDFGYIFSIVSSKGWSPLCNRLKRATDKDGSAFWVSISAVEGTIRVKAGTVQCVLGTMWSATKLGKSDFGGRLLTKPETSFAVFHFIPLLSSPVPEVIAWHTNSIICWHLLSRDYTELKEYQMVTYGGAFMERRKPLKVLSRGVTCQNQPGTCVFCGEGDGSLG